MSKNYILISLLILFSLPLILILINPSMELGGFGIFLGVVGTYISPIVILGVILYILNSSIKKKKDH